MQTSTTFKLQLSTTEEKQNIVAYFVRGTNLLNPPRFEEEKTVLRWLTSLSHHFAFRNEHGSASLSTLLDESLSRWEYNVGEFHGTGVRINVYRFYPDWCIEVHYLGDKELAFFECLVEDVRSRFFAQPFRITVSPSLKKGSVQPDASLTSSQDSWKIHRSPNSYCAAHASTSIEEMRIEGLDNGLLKKILFPLLVVEYDLRIMQKNLHGLQTLSPLTKKLQEQLEDHVTLFVSHADPENKSFSSTPYREMIDNLTTQADYMKKNVSTLAQVRHL